MADNFILFYTDNEFKIRMYQKLKKWNFIYSTLPN